MNAPDSPALRWRKSSRSSGDDGGTCVEVANMVGAIAIRDSKDPGGPAITLTPAAFHTLLSSVKTSHADL